MEQVHIGEEATPEDLSDEKYLHWFCKEAAHAFFDQYGLIRHQINSYNEFVDNGIQRIVDSLGVVDVEPDYDPSKKGGHGWRHARVTFEKVELEKPTMWTEKQDGGEEAPKLLPKHARLQNMTYSCKMTVEVNVQVWTQELFKSDKSKTGKVQHSSSSTTILSEDTRKIVMGSIPVMVKSKHCWLHELGKSDCPFDIGGYFIIKGMEKVFIAQERRSLSRLWVTDKPCWTVQYQSQTKQKRTFVQLVESTEAVGSGGTKVIHVSFLYTTIPIWIMFFALGASSDKEVVQMINVDGSDTGLVNLLLCTIREADKKCEGFRTRETAIKFVHDKVKETKFPPSDIEECMTNYLFPNIDGDRNKALFLGDMVKNLLLACSGKRKCDNIHDFRNKRLELAGDLLARELYNQIKHAERRMVRAMQKDLNGDRALQDIEHYFDASIITNGLCRAFSTGAWSHPYKRMETSTGIVANLRRVNPVQMLSDLRKTRQQVQYSGKSGDARYPNPSYWGKLCFLSTPDGENCGLVKNLAATGLVSSYQTECILQWLELCGMMKLENIPLRTLHGMRKVLVNGAWLGSCKEGRSFVSRLKSLRREGKIHFEVEIKWDQDQGEVRIFSDAGRIMRPLLIVENLHRARKFSGGCNSFESLLTEQIIEFVGVEEEEDCQTAWGVKYLFKEGGDPSSRYTHCELDVSLLLGLSCGIIPFANHNFARRVLFQSEKHSQQAIGFSTANPTIRVDTMAYQFYPHAPLFRPFISDCLGKSSSLISKPELFNGQNAIVAVNVHQGYNQEDSLIMNQASLERGMFRLQWSRSS